MTDDPDVGLDRLGIHLGKLALDEGLITPSSSARRWSSRPALSLDLDGRTVVTGTVKAQEAGEMALRSLEAPRVLLKDLWIRER